MMVEPDKPDTRYMGQRADGLWLVRVPIPTKLRPAIGVGPYEKSLRTTDHATALARRDDVVAVIRHAFKLVEAGHPFEPDLALLDAWQTIAEAGFYRPGDSFRHEGQQFEFVRTDGGYTTWLTRDPDSGEAVVFQAPGSLPPPRPPHRAQDALGFSPNTG